MAMRRGPKPGTVNNPRGVNQYGRGGFSPRTGSNKITVGPSVSSGVESLAGSMKPLKPKYTAGAKTDIATSKIKNAVVGARNSTKAALNKRKVAKYASGSGDKSKSGLGYKITRARIKNRGKTRGIRTAAATVSNKVKSASAAIRSRVSGAKVARQANKFASGSGEPKLSMRRRLANRLGRLRNDKV
jgi:hypothetical protein